MLRVKPAFLECNCAIASHLVCFLGASVQLHYTQSMFGHRQLLDAKYKTRILFLLPQCDAKCN